MKRLLRILLLFIAALVVVPFLPFYIARSMMRSQTAGGDIITWEWDFRTLYSFWSDYNYFRPEEQFILWLGINIGLACFYALVIALIFDLLTAYLFKEKRTGNEYTENK